MNPLRNLFLSELADSYDAEKRLVRALPKLAKSTTSKALSKLILTHLKETIGHVKKLETVFKSFDAKIKTGKCLGTVGNLSEGEEIIAEFKGTPALNAAIISAAQKAEHHEIASYGCLHEWAGLLGNKAAAGIIEEILHEEETANQSLIVLARSDCNNEALGGCHDSNSSCLDKKSAVLNGRRGMRPASVKKSRALGIATN